MLRAGRGRPVAGTGANSTGTLAASMPEPSSETRRRKPHRTWPQRLTTRGVCLAALACFVAACVLAGGQWVLSQRKFAPLAQTTTQRSGANDLEVVAPDPTSGAAPDGGTATTLPALPSPDTAEE